MLIVSSALHYVHTRFSTLSQCAVRSYMMAKLLYARKAAPLYKDPEYMMIVSTFYVKLFPARILGLPGKVHTRVNCILGF